MTATTWSKFFWADWESDERLKLCSPGAQALWMRMLCVCAKADGYLVINGQKLAAQDMAALTGWAVKDVQRWWGELAKWGVFSTDGRGRVFNRRMIRDAKRAKTARENGQKGGNPTLGKTTGNSASDNPLPTDDLTDLSGVRADINQEPEAISQKTSVPDGTGADAPSDDEVIRDCRARGSAGAWELARRVLSDRGDIPRAKTGDIIGKWRRDFALKDDELWEVAEAAWRNGTREPVPFMTKVAAGIQQRRGSVAIDAPSERQQRAWMEDWREKGAPVWRRHERGPYPGEEGCRVSPALQREYGVEPVTGGLIDLTTRRATA